MIGSASSRQVHVMAASCAGEEEVAADHPGREMALPTYLGRQKRPCPLHCLGIAMVLSGQKDNTHPTRILYWVPLGPSICLAPTFLPAKQGGGKACSSWAYKVAVSSPATESSMGA